MNTPAKRYVEIFEEKVENGKSVLRYYGYDHKMHTIGSGDVQALVDCMSDTVFPNGVPNFDGKERYTVTLDLEHCTAQNPAVRTASPYVCKLVPDNGYTFTDNSAGTDGPDKIALNCTVEMGGVDITADAFKSGDVRVSNVTGNITVTVEPNQSPRT